MIRVSRLDNSGDDRGASYAFPGSLREFYFGVKDVHVTSLAPGSVRGNHFHPVKSEILVVVHLDRWSLHWDSGPDTTIHRQEIEGSGCTVVEIPPNCSHAIRNEGHCDLVILGLSDHKYEAAHPDAIHRQVV